MAYVFGNAITDATLQAMPEFQGKKITLQHKASVSLRLKHEENKDVMVRQQVEKLMEKAVDDGEATTICIIYNATGDTLKLVTYQDWSGHVGFMPYPPIIENGQKGVFVHSGNQTSSGAVVYRGKNKDGEDRDWMQAWTTSSTQDNKAYCEIREVGHWKFGDGALWYVVKSKLDESTLNHVENNEGGYTTVVIGDSPTNSVFEAVLAHPK